MRAENLRTVEIRNIRSKVGGYDLRLGLAHDFVTPNEPVTMRLIRPHCGDVDDVVACDEAKSENTADEEFCSKRDWSGRGEDDSPPTIVKGSSEPSHVFDHVLCLTGQGEHIGCSRVM